MSAIVLLILLGVFFIALWFFRPKMPAASFQVTLAYQTVASRLTEAIPSTPAFTEQVLADKLTPSPTVSPSPQAPVSQATTPDLPQKDPLLPPSPPDPTCDRAAAGIPIDVTVPDETEFRPGQTFTKIWRLQNIGSCTWTSAYAVQFFYGDQMSAPEAFLLGREVAPEEVVEIAVDLVAPAEPGVYQGNWKLRNTEGFLFGIGPKGDAPFWVRIVVVRVATPTHTPTLSPTPTLTPTPAYTDTPTPTPTPPIETSGNLVLQISQAIDLDTGLSDPVTGQDLAYLLVTDFHLLSPQTGAVLGVFGASEPGLSACQAAGMSPASIALESLTQGSYLCYRTDTNRLGWLRYDGLNQDDDSAAFTFRTWANP